MSTMTTATSSNLSADLSLDHYLVDSQARFLRKNTANRSGSLPPPPRARKLSAPSPVTATPSKRLPSPPPMLRDPLNRSSSSLPSKPSPASPSSVAASTEPAMQRIEIQGGDPSLNDSEKQGDINKLYAESVSSSQPYRGPLYKPIVDNTSSRASNCRISAASHVKLDSQRPAEQSVGFPNETSVEDYSDLLYPELSSPHGSQAKRDSVKVHDPSIRKSMPPFNFQDGIEGPVEIDSMGPTASSFVKERRPSKIDKVRGIETRASSRKGSTDRLLPKVEIRRDSFIEFDGVPQVLPGGLSDHSRSDSIASDNIPAFNVPRVISSISVSPQPKLGNYIALVDAVDDKHQTLDSSPQLATTQAFIDGSDKLRSARSSSPALGNNRPPTHNLLDQNERAKLVQKNQKIAQVLGPGVVPIAQTQTQPRLISNETDFHREALHRSAKSEAVGLDDPKWEAEHERRLRDAEQRMEKKSSWSALNHDTIFLTGSGRRHSSPMSPMATGFEAHVGAEWDAASTASMSSLGSVIEVDGLLDKKDRVESAQRRSKSLTSFMELSDDDGMKTPKRRSIDDGLNLRDGGARSSAKYTVSPIIKAEPSLDEVASSSSYKAVISLYTPTRENTIRTKGSTLSYLSLSDDEIDRHGWKGDPKSDAWKMDRQRKREKLAKIHRFLGSKVPPELVLGYSSTTGDLPPLAQPVSHQEPEHRKGGSDSSAGNGTKSLKKRRNSSSAAVHNSWEASSIAKEWEIRNKDTMTGSERLREIRRAQKIEKIFGEQPPHRLSVTRTSTSPIAQSVPSHFPKTSRRHGSTSSIERPLSALPFKAKKQRSPPGTRDGRPSTSGSSRPSTSRSTTELIASYHKDRAHEKRTLTGSAEDDINFSQTIQVPEAYFPVGTALGSPWEDPYGADVLGISQQSISTQGSRAAVMTGVPTSRRFLSYRNSLNTLGRILDQDDRQSLNELHAVLGSDDEEEYSEHVDRHTATASASTQILTSSERQGTLQPRASLSSINTVATNSTFQTLTPEPMGFQARRKRAAKLSHFFGASYRDLFGEVLNRIERGMLEEARHGEMSQDEMKHLLKQLNRLKRRQSQLS